PSDSEVPIYYQCGGKNYDGSKQCADGLVCKEWNEWYSQCLPSSNEPSFDGLIDSPTDAPTDTPSEAPTGEFAAAYYQCGGSNYDGPTQCEEGLVCYEWSEWYSQCLRESDASSTR
ncbi:unnamed protein product, partial [Aphanomyces euteiches]